MDFFQWWQTINWGDAAGWFSGLSTSAVLLIGVLTLRNERRRDRALAVKSSEATERQDQADRRQQASQVTAWFARDPDAFVVSNNSGGVIYDVLAALVPGRGESDGTKLSPDFYQLVRLIPPGQISVPCAQGWAGMNFLPSVDLTFRDANGVTWLRNNYGKLSERESDVFSQYDLMQPHPYYERPNIQIF